MSKINLQSGILTVENRRSREKKRICSEVSVNIGKIFMTDNCTTDPTGGLQLRSSNWLTKQETAKMLLLKTSCELAYAF